MTKTAVSIPELESAVDRTMHEVVEDLFKLPIENSEEIETYEVAERPGSVIEVVGSWPGTLLLTVSPPVVVDLVNRRYPLNGAEPDSGLLDRTTNEILNFIASRLKNFLGERCIFMTPLSLEDSREEVDLSSKQQVLAKRYTTSLGDLVLVLFESPEDTMLNQLNS